MEEQNQDTEDQAVNSEDQTKAGEDQTQCTTGTDPVDTLEAVLTSIAQLPGVRINRTNFLRQVLIPHCPADVVENAIAQGPERAGVDAALVRQLADESIVLETTRVTALSTLSGMPGGAALVMTIPADLAQNLAHILRVAQKLAYLYGWPELFSGEDESLDEGTKRVLVLFIGVMLGVSGAAEAVTRISAMIAVQAVLQLPRKVLSNGWVYIIVKNVAIHVMSRYVKKSLLANGLAKVIPVVGGIVSGSLTLAGFMPMCGRLRDHFEKDRTAGAQQPESPGDAIDAAQENTESLADDTGQEEPDDTGK